ncbi:MAG: helix-hairpin-helix domain-containing protein [Bacteroidales bacterium]|nr:helix-hairpin-helix domain-containing protein [Bacteroidales bacterium]
MEEGKNRSRKKTEGLSASFVTGAIALVFLIIGYEVALFVHKAAVLRIEANRDKPDTVYVYVPDPARAGFEPNSCPDGRQNVTAERHNAPHSPVVQAVRERTRPVESFRFNPNTVSVEDLQRLGFSERQAQSIENYRLKGGRFRRKSDFAKSYVVADSVYARLEPFIDIPLLDINKADSVALLDLPGIGPYFAGKVVRYRQQLQGYSTLAQLMEIWHFDQEKYDGLKDLISCSAPEPYPIWTLPEAELSRHPHISKAEAHAIVLFRNHHTPEECTLDALIKAGVLSEDHAARLKLCRLSVAVHGREKIDAPPAELEGNESQQ